MPPDEQNLRYLFRADTGVFQDVAGTIPAIGGTSVRLWKDQSGNYLDLGRDAPGPMLLVNQINGLPALRFTGSEWFHFTNVFIAPERTIYVVLKISDTGILTIVAGGLHSLQWRLDNLKMRFVETAIVDIGSATSPMSSGTWTQANSSWNGTSGLFRQNGSANGGVSKSYSAVSSPCRVFGYNKVVDGEFFKGDLSLLMEYSVVHDTSTRQSVESWINSVWGV